MITFRNGAPPHIRGQRLKGGSVLGVRKWGLPDVGRGVGRGIRSRNSPWKPVDGFSIARSTFWRRPLQTLSFCTTASFSKTSSACKTSDFAPSSPCYRYQTVACRCVARPSLYASPTECDFACSMWACASSNSFSSRDSSAKK